MPAAFKLKPPPPPLEQDEALWLLDWARTQRHRGKPLSDFLLMIPNGAYLRGDYSQRGRAMGKMQMRGFRNGVSDYFLAIPKGGQGGLWLELKRTQGGVVSGAQDAFHADMRQDYACVIAKGWHAAMLAIGVYLQTPGIP